MHKATVPTHFNRKLVARNRSIVGVLVASVGVLTGICLVAVAVAASQMPRPARFEYEGRRNPSIPGGQHHSVNMSKTGYKSGLLADTSASGIGQVALTPIQPGFVVYQGEGQSICRGATPGEVSAMLSTGQMKLHGINDHHLNLQAASGLTITLRATQQLETFPQAKAAFLKAAQYWMTQIQSPITIVIDVDFGPTFFGQAYGANVLGRSTGQAVASPTGYPLVRTALINGGSPNEQLAYNFLPLSSLPTDLGSTAGILEPTALARAHGLLNPVADPDGEMQQLGSPPKIGFNSQTNFDFDPRDGIDAGKFDFLGTAIHEIGHVLGFVSSVGRLELDQQAGNFPTTWDFARFRPGTVTSPIAFTTAQRIQSSGGNQVFVGTDGIEVPLSTGRPDGTGGDGHQASHWKDDALAGTYIGIMHPILTSGQTQGITHNDVATIDLLGYDLAVSGVALLPGLPQVGVVAPPSQGVTGFLGDTQFAIAVTDSAELLTVELQGSGNVDLYTRFGTPVTIQNGQVVADQASATNNFNETITISPTSSPSLMAGQYYIGVVNRSLSTTSFTVKATITGRAATVSAASFVPGADLASESIASVFGSALATVTQPAGSDTLPTSIAGTTVRVRDSAGIERLARLFFVSPGQVNFEVPQGTANGVANITVTSGDGTVSIGTVTIATVSPGVFTANNDGKGVPAAYALRVKGAVQSNEPVATSDPVQQKYVPLAIDLGPSTDQVFLVLFGTGLRFRSALSAVTCKAGGTDAPVSFAGAAPGFIGLDQVNVLLPRSLIGRGEVDVVLMVDGKSANSVRISIK